MDRAFGLVPNAGTFGAIRQARKRLQLVRLSRASCGVCRVGWSCSRAFVAILNPLHNDVADLIGGGFFRIRIDIGRNELVNKLVSVGVPDGEKFGFGGGFSNQGHLRSPLLMKIDIYPLRVRCNNNLRTG